MIFKNIMKSKHYPENIAGTIDLKEILNTIFQIILQETLLRETICH